MRQPGGWGSVAALSGCLLGVVASAGVARADRLVIRMATAAPDATSWARELRAFAREVENSTEGEVAIKWYFGGIAGDEQETFARVDKAQIDGIAGGVLCSKVVPSMRVFTIPGLIQGRDEANYVSQKMTPQYAVEARRSGYAFLFTSGLGPILLFTRPPLTTMEQIRATRLWHWNLDAVGAQALRNMGFSVQPGTLEQASRDYDAHKIDGFIAVPSAALAFQWSTQAKYIVDLRIGYLEGCLLMANRTWDRLTHVQREAITAAAVKTARRFDDLGREQDRQLLGGLFEKQGLKILTPSASVRAQYFEAAREARERLGEQLLPRPLLDQVMRILADYRAERVQK
jgi:TRAP-type C4-dicarboxylate transport system substrate-binding protein